MLLPTPPGDADAVKDWVRVHLGHLSCDDVMLSPIRGGQEAADAALARLDLTGYAARRNEVLPVERRGATGLSPYIRHGLIQLPQVWQVAATAPPRDRAKFRDELLWQEYSRHVYARLGRATARPLRHEPPRGAIPAEPAELSDGAQVALDPGPWDRRMACMDAAMTELVDTGWLVNQVRMWLASQWTVRHGATWQDGEDAFFQHLLDGSRAANRLGWQWTVGTGTGKPYGFSRWQVTKRAPELCRRCPLAAACPVEDWPSAQPGPRVLHGADSDSDSGSAEADLLRDGVTPTGPDQPQQSGTPRTVWLTAESLGDADPALLAHPELPAVFVFDAPLLARLRLSGKRLAFLAECLADLATHRDVEVRLGDPVEELAGLPLAATWTPVPGWASRAGRLDVVALHPWPWLRRPGPGSLRSFSAWAGQRRARPVRG